jgi:GNAT superfamily N-acetyltransferase
VTTSTSTPFVRVRGGRATESRDIADLWLRSRAASVPAIPPPVHTPEEVREWFQRVVLTEREVWIAEAHNVVGILVLDDDWIDQLYVEPGHTSLGVGAQLMSTAKRERSSGLRLWTFEANVRARRFYERHGFVETGSTTGDNEEGAPDVRYEWSPSPAVR